MVGGGTSKGQVGRVVIAVGRAWGGSLLVREESGDGLDCVAHMFAAAVVVGGCSPALEVCDAVLDADAA